MDEMVIISLWKTLGWSKGTYFAKLKMASPLVHASTSGNAIDETQSVQDRMS